MFSQRGRMGAALAALILATGVAAFGQATPSPRIQFVYTSDAHYGIQRADFQGAKNVDARIVNAAMVAKINSLPGTKLPYDGGIGAGEKVGAIDLVIETGDIANRSEMTGSSSVQGATASWSQFKTDYLDGLTVTSSSGAKAPLLLLPGNHDVTDAIGYWKAMAPSVDKASMVEIYNRMMSPATPRTAASYDYSADKVHYSRDLGGIHFVFVNLWPDSAERAWIDQDLKSVKTSTPVLLFAHDPPDVDPNHFSNPNGAHDINANDKFENLLSDRFADGATIDAPAAKEQKALEDFLLAHPNITAYFHGHVNFNQFYDWTGVDGALALHAFRVDSPMKGQVSKNDETKLSFQLVTIDAQARTMTVRECLWNPDPAKPSSAVAWGASTTIALLPRPGRD